MKLEERLDQIPALEIVEAEIIGKICGYIALLNQNLEGLHVCLERVQLSRWIIIVRFCNGKNNYQLIRHVDLIHFHLHHNREEAVSNYINELLEQLSGV